MMIPALAAAMLLQVSGQVPAGLGGALGGKVQAAWKFEEGKAVYIRTVQSSNTEMSVLGMEQSQKQKQISIQEILPVKKDGENWILKITTVGMFQEQVTAAGRMVFDSEDDDASDPNLKQFLGVMVGAPLTVTVSPEGKVLKVDGVAELFEKITKANPQAAAVVKSIINEDMLRSQTEQVFAILPKEAVGAGDTWKNETALALGPLGKIKIVMPWKAESVTGGILTASGKPELEWVAGGGGAGGLPFKVSSADIKGKDAETTYKFDTGSGKLQTMSGKMTLEGPMKLSAMGQEIEMTMKVVTSTEANVTATKPSLK